MFTQGSLRVLPRNRNNVAIDESACIFYPAASFTPISGIIDARKAIKLLGT